MLHPHRLAPLLVAGAAALAGGPALGWTIESPIGEGCHEQMTREALARVGYAGREAPPPLAGDDVALAESMPFETTDADRNILALSLLLGARFPDVFEHAPLQDFSDLIEVHNADEMQALHALRSASQDGEAGDEAAAAATTALARGLVEDTLLTAGWEGTPDAEMRATVRLSLLYVGETDVSVSALYFAAGWALHLIQDSFAHCYRTGPELGQIAEVMNWVEAVSGELVIERDGQRHSSMLDDCGCTSPATQDHYEAAVQASAEVLAAATLTMSQVERELALDAALDRWMTFEPGCIAENDFCGSPAWLEVQASGDECPEAGCAAAGAPGSRGQGPLAPAVFCAALAALAARGRRRAPRRLR